MPYLYVSEPDSIPVEALTQLLTGTAYIAIAGDTSFSGSTDHTYETLVIRSATQVDIHIKKQFPGLKYIVRVGTGLDNVDLAYCKVAGITVFNAPGANADAVSEYVVATLLYRLRGLYKLDDEAVRRWDRFAFRGSSLKEHTVGIVGFGNIGRLLYEKLTAFSCRRFYIYDPYLQPGDMPENAQLTELDDVLANSTIVSLHLPLNDETKHLIDGSKLALLKPGSILVNSARGGIVNESALLGAMQHKPLHYIADTVEGEPVVNEQLLSHPNVTITPHIGSLTSASEFQMLHQAMRSFLDATGL